MRIALRKKLRKMHAVAWNAVMIELNDLNISLHLSLYQKNIGDK